MTDRYTRKDAENALECLAEALGKPLGSYRELKAGEVSTYGSETHTTIPGGWYLDCNATYGGCVIQEMDDRGGTGVSQPFGSMRHSYRDFCDMVYFTMNALSVARKGSLLDVRA